LITGEKKEVKSVLSTHVHPTLAGVSLSAQKSPARNILDQYMQKALL